MNTLPNDIHYIIYNFLKTKDKINFLSISKKININSKNYIIINLNKKYSLKYYRNRKFREYILTKVVNPSKQIKLILSSIYINKLNLLSNINYLNLSYCRGLKNIYPLQNIHYLNLSNTDIEDIIILKNVKYLDLSYTKIINIENIKYMNNLYYLSLSGCKKIINFNNLENIYSLDVSETYITNEYISTLKNTNSLNISRCKNVTEVNILNKLNNLKILKINTMINYIINFHLIKNIKIIDTYYSY